MDIPRDHRSSGRPGRRMAYGAAAVLAVVLAGIGLLFLEPAPPEVDRATVWVDEVKRGALVRQVRGPGALVPESIRWIPARTEGRVERVSALPGTRVEEETILLELSNPEVRVAAREAKWELEAALAELANLSIQVESGLLTQRASSAGAAAEHEQARLRLEADEELAREGLIAPLELTLSKVRVRELAQKAEIEERRLAIATEAVSSRMAVQEAQVDRLRGVHSLREDRVRSLTVRSGLAGVLQEVMVEAGQRVSPGSSLARVADPGTLKAEIRIPETRARDVRIGQEASIDTRNEIIRGRVLRIDPAVENGTVTVDIALEEPLPRGARPDLSVNGTIELERLQDVLYVGRPAFAREEASVGLFRLTGDGGIAVRVPVALGRSSVNFIEVRDGLAEEDSVVLSDTSKWDAYDRIRLN